MSGTPNVDPVPERFPADAALVRRLVSAQSPRWAGLPVRPVAEEGWDNRTFRLGSDMSVRLPSAAAYAEAVDKEHRWLPVLARRLPLRIPVPLAKGAPGEGYPHAWSVYRWLSGEPASRENIADPVRFAGSLAAFLAALRRVDPVGGPAPGQHNWFRGGPLLTYDGEVRRALGALAGRVRADAVAEVWRCAVRAPWDGRPVWFHGDVAPGNLLVRDGELTAVIDFGTCGVGDPACDLTIAWTLLSGESRTALRDGLSADPALWARGRGWALWKALTTWAGALRSGGGDAAAARHVVDQLIAET
ncbi:aminoglycoside phosphotransferase family protein [Streptomyces sp. RFCAC02]|uniref:aminoglycoside phosphotransferase family protein n=1 Tax=Streptomyces sp. RFCAC02 TaxID=2499143 RepID=UPI001021328C|nr:aminoglycoside phosphotransferase family protein [Streptomyces sp. RFCAC02]